jgi:selenide,water dikinase
VLQEILKNSQGLGPAFPIPKELLVGIETSDDAAVYEINPTQAVIATTDFFMPIVDDPYHFGRIAATNALSDVYAMGGKPLFALAIVAMPVGQLSTQTIGQILKGGQDVCHEAGIVIAGGHTIDCVEPIYGLVALGLVDPKHIKKNSMARPGDQLILSKPLGVGILSAALKKNTLSSAEYDLMLKTTTQLNTPGFELAQLEGVHAMTDVTGFGLLGHTLEMAKGSGLSIELNWSMLPLLAGVETLALNGNITGASGRNWASYGQHIDLSDKLPIWAQDLLTDPQTSGGLLVCCSPETVPAVLAIFSRHGFDDAAVVGHIGELEKSRLIVK